MAEVGLTLGDALGLVEGRLLGVSDGEVDGTTLGDVVGSSVEHVPKAVPLGSIAPAILTPVQVELSQVRENAQSLLVQHVAPHLVVGY